MLVHANLVESLVPAVSESVSLILQPVTPNNENAEPLSRFDEEVHRTSNQEGIDKGAIGFGGNPQIGKDGS